jgi:hypothetical protein
MRSLFTLVPLIAALALGACASSTHVATDTPITFNADPGALPFDPHGARLHAAMNALAGVAGRTMTLDLDVALLHEYRAWFETGLVTAVENAAHDLGEIKRTRPEAWSEMGPRLQTLSFRYVASLSKVEIRLEANREVVSVGVPAKATTLLPHEAALLALEAQYDAGLPEKYANGVPPSVSVAEKRAYVRALTGQKPPPRKVDDPANAPGVGNELRALSILRAIRFYDVAMPLELRAEIHDWLVNEGNYFRDAYVVFPDAVKVSPASSPFHRAEAAWVDWAQKNADRFTDTERVALAKLVFVRQPSKDRPGAWRPNPFAFPGFDRIAFGLKVFEDWMEAEHKPVPGRDRLFELFEIIVCPFEIDGRGERAIAANCHHDFYGAILESEATQKRFLDFLLDKKDDVVAETAVANFMRMKTVRAATYFWRGLEAEEASWKGATRAMAEEFSTADAARVQDEAVRLWQAYPARRGTLLYLLSQLDRYGNDRIAWGGWGDAGSRASAADFKAFLAHGRRALATAWVVWPVLGRGWSRSDALVPLLDGFVDDPLVPFFHPQDPHLALRQIAGRMCAEKNFADLTKLHAYLVDRIKKVPSDEKPLADLFQETSRGRCKPNARPIVRAAPLDAPSSSAESVSASPNP